MSEGANRELQQAGISVLGVPMHNFSIPSTLKLLTDPKCVPVDFRVHASGPAGY